MEDLRKRISSIPPEINKIIEERMSHFASFSSRPKEDWFSELCFCLLTANSRAQTAINIQNSIGFNGFANLNQEKLASKIREHKHRFHNNKSKYIVQSRNFKDVKDIIQPLVKQSEHKAREWLVNNIKGLGLKEASHFLRNTGHTQLAILDRHILRLMSEMNLIDKEIKISPKNYLEIEKEFIKIANSFKTTPAKLDLQLWYLQTGNVLK